MHGDELTPLGGDLEGRRDVEGQADRLHGHHQHADGPDVDLIVDKMEWDEFRKDDTQRDKRDFYL